jgi:hypothetical protein
MITKDQYFFNPKKIDIDQNQMFTNQKETNNLKRYPYIFV